MPDSYGDITGEYLALRTEAGLVEDWYEVVWVTGSDAGAFLESVISQEVAGAVPGTVRRSLLLQPQGKLQAVFWLLAGNDRHGLVTHHGGGGALAAALARYRIRVDADIDLDPRPGAALWGPAAPALLEGIGRSVGARRWASFDAGGGVAGVIVADGIVADVGFGESPRYVVIGGTQVTVRRVGRHAADLLRVELGEPLMGRDVDESTIPQESGLVADAVSFTKGCFVGQELVARIDSRGHVNRRLAGLRIGKNVVPPEGASVHVGDRQVGTLTSPTESFAYVRAPIGLVLLRREVAAGDTVEVRWEGGGTTATVVDLPFAGFTEF